ncbi:MAG: beta-N-acetylhexosaminidase [Defluviitaleaceae bacterium]|nr:beta-N-acetylhexosaminidase [Defluviitaleaceae bacterium]
MDIKNLTLKQKIGQMFLVPIEGTALSADTREHILKYNIGNFIYFAKNLTDYQSIRALSDSLQQAAQDASGIPAFISTDQEGGMVARAYSGATHYPSNMAITAAGMGSSLEKMGEMVATELKGLGINLNHAPVLDVNNNPQNPVIGIRSYSDKPEVVATMATDYIRGLQKGGVLANAKHFPGHGDTHQDSHLALPSIAHDMDRLNAVELVPFKAAIADGVGSVMTAHIIFKAIDGERPATLSPDVLNNLLRRDLGFDGLILTDSMTMQAIQDHYGLEKGCVLAVQAGVDILCLNANQAGQARCFDAVLAAVESGDIPMEKIDAAVARILKYKAIYAAGGKNADLVEKYPEHEALADEISEKSITLVRANDALLPLTGKNVFVISPPPSTANIADDTLVKQETFCKKAAEALGCDYAEISTNPAAAEIAATMQKAAADIVLYASYNAIQNPGQVQLFNALKAAGKQVVLVSLRVPYDILVMESADAYIAAYEYTNRAVGNAIKAIMGEVPFAGRLPVALG